MNVQPLYVFGDTSVTSGTPFAALVSSQEETHPLLALAYFDDKKEIGFFVLLDIQEKTVSNEIVSASKDIMALRMTYDASTLCWNLIEDIGSAILMFRSISLQNKQHPLVETLLITHDYYDIHPTQFVDVDMGIATLVYMRRPDWDELPELLRGRVFLQEQQVQVKSLVSADSFLIATAKETTVLLLLKSTFLQNQKPLITQHFLLVCYDKYLDTQHWEYTFEEGFSLASQEEVFDLSALHASAMLIAGPVSTATGQATWIVGIGATRIQPKAEHDEQAISVVARVSHLVWLRSDGELLQRCLDVVFLRLHLCVSGTIVIGVDQVNEQWRVWNWFLQSESTFHTTLPLEAGVQRAYVVAGEQKEGQEAKVWLIEQYSREVRISCRFAETLEKVSPDISIPHFTLLEQEFYGDLLDWHMPVGLLPCGETLIVTGVDSENHLALYQIE